VVREVEDRLSGWSKSLDVAVMGCPVNGPGEAREADVGIAAGKGMALLFRKGKVIRQVKAEEMVAALISEAESILKS
jgi:(E)-4-hydroxy-3-methylbut-2-enyl-diphosphate synthase